MRRIAHPERGMALITVLMLVAVMGALTAATLEVMSRSVAMASNGRSAMQGHHYARGAGLIAATRIAALTAASPERLTLAGGWSNAPVIVPTTTGSITIEIEDASPCLNVNSVVMGAPPSSLVRHPLGTEQFIALAQAVGIDPARARQNALELVDYIDTDPFAQVGGREDDLYRRASIPRLPPNGLLAHPSELLAISSMRAADYEAIQAYLCALPTSEAMAMNVNTMSARHAPLIAMLAPGQISAAQARAALAARPDAGWTDRQSFWMQPAIAGVRPARDALRQISTTSSLFKATISVDDGGFVVDEQLLLKAEGDRVNIVQRIWGREQ